MFSGFWKTVKKLLSPVYCALKSGLDILKKLFKKVVDFLEAGMKSVVVAIGHTIAKIVAWAYPIPEYETHDVLDGIQCIKGLKFENTEQTIYNTPQVTFFPRTVEEISRIIKHAKAEGRRVRAAGMKHSWTDLFSNDGEYLMYLLPLEVTDHLTFGRIGLAGAEAELSKWQSELDCIEVNYFWISYFLDFRSKNCQQVKH